MVRGGAGLFMAVLWRVVRVVAVMARTCGPRRVYRGSPLATLPFGGPSPLAPPHVDALPQRGLDPGLILPVGEGAVGVDPA